MLSKLICAAVMTAAGTTAHSINTRSADIVYQKVNRDSEYGAPAAPSYSAPAPSYSAPAPSYSAPAPSYSAPEPSYSAPSTGYGVSYEEEAGLDLTSIIIPLLALVGLSLLFPTYVSLTTVRKRRDADEGMSDPQHVIFNCTKFLLPAATTLLCPVQTTPPQHCTAHLHIYTTILDTTQPYTSAIYNVQQTCLWFIHNCECSLWSWA